MTPELFVVVGPNGSGKSSAIYETELDDSIIFVNPDDIARSEFADIVDEDERNYRAWLSCNAQRDALLAERITFGFETVGSHPSKVEFIKKAKDLGYSVTVLFVSTEDPRINIERIRQRELKGGHGVPDEKVIQRYYRTLGLLKDYFEAADQIFIWDNTRDAESEERAQIRELVRKTSEGITIREEAHDVKWIQEYLLQFI